MSLTLAASAQTSPGGAYGVPAALTCPTTQAGDLLVFLTSIYGNLGGSSGGTAPSGSLSGWTQLWNLGSAPNGGAPNSCASQCWYKSASGSEGGSSLNPGSTTGTGGIYQMLVLRGNWSSVSATTDNTGVVTSGSTTSAPAMTAGRANIQAISLMYNGANTGGPSISPTADGSLSDYLANYVQAGLWLYNSYSGAATITPNSASSTNASRIVGNISVVVPGNPICMII